MKGNVWLVPFNTKELVPPYEQNPQCERIQPAQSFTLKLKSVYVARDLEGFLRNKNSFLVLSQVALGERPPVQRIHHYDQNVPFNKVVKSFIADSIYWCEDYAGTGRIWLEMVLMEVDTDAGERRETLKAAKTLAEFAGAAYPLFLPYLQTPAEVGVAVQKILRALEDKSHIVRLPFALYPPGQKGAPLQTGNYILFANPTNGARYTLEASGEMTRADRVPIDESYAVFTVEAGAISSERWIPLQKGATFLTQLKKTGIDEAISSIDFLEETMRHYTNYQRLLRFQMLKQKEPVVLTPQERDLMERLRNAPALKPFLE